MADRKPTDVKLLHWPAEARARDRYRTLGVPRLLIVEAGAPAPVSADLDEDWVRPPVTKLDLDSRIEALRSRTEEHRKPVVDPHGVLRYAGRSTPISPIETDLLACLVREFGELVSREVLHECLPERGCSINRNVLDLHVMRLRKRIHPMGLSIRTVWGRGYLLETGSLGDSPG